jgi:hypothetical protein
MLETLVRQGKLRQVDTTGAVAGCHCGGGSCHNCGCSTNLSRGRSYELVSNEP